MDYFSVEEIETQFSELLKSYRNYHLHRTEMHEGERTDFEAMANIAKDTFQSAFYSKFAQNERLLVEQPESTALDIVKRWAREAISPLLGGLCGTRRRETANTPRQCSNTLMKLTSRATSRPASRRESAIWPFIQKITFVFPFHPAEKPIIVR